jgi:recombinational DNA repair ATPase RecF
MKSQQQYQQYQQLQNSINKPMNTTFPQPGVNQQVKLMEASKNQYGVNNAAGGSTMLPAIGILSGQQLQQQQQQQKYMMQQQQQIQQQAQLQQQAQQRIMQITNQQKRKKKYRLNNYGNKIGQQPNMMSQIKPMQIGGDPYNLKK